MPNTQRVFVALWPPAQVRAQLARLAASLVDRIQAGRLVPAGNLHLTLAFIGSLDEARVAELARHVEHCRCVPFVWRVDHMGAFRRARVLWAGGASVPALDHLVRDVRALLDRLDVAYDRKPFAPHVTLVRDASRLPEGFAAIDPPVNWTCERAVLVRSVETKGAPCYQPLTAT